MNANEINKTNIDPKALLEHYSRIRDRTVEFARICALCELVTSIQSQNERLVEALEKMMVGQVVEKGRVVVRSGPSGEAILFSHNLLTEMQKTKGL